MACCYPWVLFWHCKWTFLCLILRKKTQTCPVKVLLHSNSAVQVKSGRKGHSTIAINFHVFHGYLFFSCHTHLFGFPSSRTLPWPFYLRRGFGAQREAGWRKQRWWFFAFCFLFNYYFFNITILLQTLLFQVSAMALLFISHSLHLALLTLFFFPFARIFMEKSYQFVTRF